jgi:general secretion pathway protein E
MVGEIRDLETAEMAIQAALTGHLVIATLHTNDAPSAITRLLELGVPAYLLRATLLGVMAQRLVRTTLPPLSRRRRKTVDVGRLEAADHAPSRRRVPAQGVQAPVGCLECRDTGYRGRVGIYEILVLTETLGKPGATTTADLSGAARAER